MEKQYSFLFLTRVSCKYRLSAYRRNLTHFSMPTTKRKEYYFKTPMMRVTDLLHMGAQMQLQGL